MADGYADAVNCFEDEVSAACSRAESELSDAEIVAELRRIANEIEEDNG